MKPPRLVWILFEFNLFPSIPNVWVRLTLDRLSSCSRSCWSGGETGDIPQSRNSLKVYFLIQYRLVSGRVYEWGAWLITTSQHSWECSGEWGSGSIHSGLRSCAATMYFQPEVLLSVTLSVVNKTVRSVCSDKKNIQMIRYNNEPETGLTLSFQVSTICTLTFMKQTQLLYNELSHFTDWKHKFKCKICDIFCEIWKLSKKSVAPSEFNFSFNRTENV